MSTIGTRGGSVESKSKSKGSSSEPGSPQATLPKVSVEEARIAREQIAQRNFVPSGSPPPDEFLPNPSFIHIIDQGQDGISVGAALASVLNFERSEQGITEFVSPRMLYEYARCYDEWSNTEHDGSSLAGGLAALMRHGVCVESQWPTPKSKPQLDQAALKAAEQNRPVAILRVDKNIEHLKAAVFEHHAVAVGATVHIGWSDPKDGIIPFGSKRRGKDYTIMGGHAFAVIGYTRNGFLVQNSWGENWGGVTLGDRHYPGIAIWTYDDAAANLGDAWVVQLSRPSYRAPLVGYDADSLDGDDLLEIKSEVSAFSYVLASSAIRPPLALGLFGDWGSGKSFFMQEMQKKIHALTKIPEKAGTSPFCRQIVQIRFNAWHYLDTDLWASLVTEIFDRLFEGIGGGAPNPKDALVKLDTELQNANGVVQKARQQLQDAENSRLKAEAALSIAIQKREDAEKSLLTPLNDLKQLLSGDDAMKQEVGKLADGLGAPELKESFEALDARVAELKTTGGRFFALLETMFATPWGWIRLVTLIAALLTPMFVIAIIEYLNSYGIQIQEFHSFALQVSGLVGAVAAWVGVLAKRGSGLIRKLESTHGQLERIRNERRANALATEQSEVLKAKADENAKRKSVQDAEDRVATIQREISDLQPGRLIKRFIEERSKSNDYRSRLGIVSLVRSDFERLSDLANPKSKNHQPKLMPVERIILYVDDLDRCKADRVIEVLEAIHLLLSFPLFMVVVAVDPRWLSRCLEQHYPDMLALRAPEATEAGHVVPSRPATAQDYLEKIFQIPFMLQPLGDDGYRRMIRGLTELNRIPDVSAPIAMTTNALSPDAAGASLQTSDKTTSAEAETIKEQAKKVVREQTAVEDAIESEDSAIERLRMRTWELEDMERLASMFRTPRSVKRFVNTYRFLRAAVRPQYVSLFEGARENPGSYRAALTLLSVVVNYSSLAPRFLQRIDMAANGTRSKQDWREFLKQTRAELAHAGAASNRHDTTPQADHNRQGKKPQAEHRRGAGAKTTPSNWEDVEWLQLCDALLSISNDEFPVQEVGELKEWLYPVARYSFALTSTAMEKGR
jgi:predicted  nucleic acid-binding Zn-ribbon protein